MNRPLCIGFLGRLTKQKNAGMLLDAFAEAFPSEHDSASLAIAGSGPEEEPLRQRSRDLNISARLEWMGQCGPDVMKRFDVFALPSSYEGMPYVLLEAMSAGLPIVATAVGGVRSVIDDDVEGFVVEPGDRAAFAGALRKLAGDPGLRERMSRCAAKRVSEFTVSRMVNETVAVYRSAIREKFPGSHRLSAAEVP